MSFEALHLVGYLFKHAVGILLLCWRRMLRAAVIVALVAAIAAEVLAMVVTHQIPPSGAAHLVAAGLALGLAYGAALTVFLDELIVGAIETIGVLEGDVRSAARASAIASEREVGDLRTSLSHWFTVRPSPQPHLSLERVVAVASLAEAALAASRRSAAPAAPTPAATPAAAGASGPRVLTAPAAVPSSATPDDDDGTLRALADVSLGPIHASEPRTPATIDSEEPPHAAPPIDDMPDATNSPSDDVAGTLASASVLAEVVSLPPAQDIRNPSPVRADLLPRIAWAQEDVGQTQPASQTLSPAPHSPNLVPAIPPLPLLPRVVPVQTIPLYGEHAAISFTPGVASEPTLPDALAAPISQFQAPVQGTNDDVSSGDSALEHDEDQRPTDKHASSSVNPVPGADTASGAFATPRPRTDSMWQRLSRALLGASPDATLPGSTTPTEAANED